MRISGCVWVAMLALTGMASAAPVRVNLRTELDSRRSKLGDPVMAKLEKPLNAGGLNLPKGAVILGHVQQVTKKDATGRAEITLLFDHVSMKGRLPVPVTATIITVELPRQEQIPDDSCDGSALRALSDVHSLTMFCENVPQYRILNRQDGTSGTVVRRATVRGPLRQASLTGPVTLEKGTIMDVVILPAASR